ncbi:MAG: UDP-N-acetylenolpyruvoylglucosamine reductase [Pseudopedobacter saltans]|uniref:UDP-N-acetylenolpyruvoylglucosamine reductase n=1 Tax=Pseudopedobacter saltans TaxID=151895 RepID=A0A2W5HCL9_9SPHI|nr:MAG: UDP-N-acetylenolpyruvoylglucosamine reductase [Pseudopedobacter saltans]
MSLIAKNISLQPFNTFGINATAAYFARFANENQLEEVLSAREKLELLTIGGGSNILLTKDFNGLVLKNEIKGINIVKEDDDHFYVKAASGENWHHFVLHCIEKNYAGVENLSLIPGCVGASPMQNIGAYGVEIKDVFYELEAFHIADKRIDTFRLEDCHFGYRESVFKTKFKNQYIILNVTYKLNKKPIFHTSYGAIQQELENMNVTELSIKAISDAVIAIRSSKLPDPVKVGNAGSFFKNPTITKDHFEKLLVRYPDLKGFPSPDNSSDVKIAAGWLIEKAGWKGYREDNIGVHAHQALVLVNYGNGSGKDIFDLSTRIIESIHEKFGIALEREVNIL